jgi:hypothetical protein
VRERAYVSHAIVGAERQSSACEITSATNKRARVDVDRRDQVSSLDTFGKFVLDIRFFSSIIYILYEGGSLRPPVVTSSYLGLK